MITYIIIGWLMMGLVVWAGAICHDIFKRQDKIVKWINEAINSKDLPRKPSPFMEEQNYTFMAFVRGFILTVTLWPIVLNRKLG